MIKESQKPFQDLKTEGIEIKASVTEEFAQILTPAALRFVASLARKFEATRQELLKKREHRQKEINSGQLPDFLPQTKSIREATWNVAPIPTDLQDRKVEITGPVDKKMIINALNLKEKGANVFMADLEDSNSPTWKNNIEGQINLRDAVNKNIQFTSPEGKKYELKKDLATLMVRPRGWHLNEEHVLVGGKPISASLFDFGLYFYHNAKN